MSRACRILTVSLSLIDFKLYSESKKYVVLFSVVSHPLSDEPDEFTVKTKNKKFHISHYPLEQSRFLYDMYQARKKYPDEKNKCFDYTLFSHRRGIHFFMPYRL